MKRGFLTALLGVWAALILPCCAHAQIYYDSEIYYDGYNVNGYTFVSDWEDGTYLYAYAELNDPNQARMSSDQNYGYYEASVSLSGSPTVSGSYSLYTDYWYFDDYRGNWYELGEDYNGVYVAAPPVVTSVTTSGSPWYGGGSYTFAINGSGFAGHSVTFSSTDPFESSSLSVASDSLIQGSVLVWSTYSFDTWISILINGMALAAAAFEVEPAAPVCAVPVSFRQADPGVVDQNNPGVLDFSYQWSSSTGRLGDLSPCEVGEKVDFDPADIPYPSPPFPPGIRPDSNPVIRSFSAVYGGGDDVNGSGGLTADSFVKPYSWRAVVSQQGFRYRCTCQNNNAWASFTNLTEMEAVMETYTGSGYWLYRNQKPNLSPANGQVPSAVATITLH